MDHISLTEVPVKRGRLHVMGASGSGSTTLARAVADAWSVPHADSDDYFWLPTAPPYVDQRPAPERLALMEALFLPRDAWVLSGSVMGWGDSLVPRFDAIVFLTIDPGVRLARLHAREASRYDGMDRSADDLARHHAFFEWAKGYDDPAFDGRSRISHEEWLSTVSCPVLRLDSARPVDDLVAAVMEFQPPVGA